MTHSSSMLNSLRATALKSREQWLDHTISAPGAFERYRWQWATYERACARAGEAVQPITEI